MCESVWIHKRRLHMDLWGGGRGTVGRFRTSPADLTASRPHRLSTPSPVDLIACRPHRRLRSAVRDPAVLPRWGSPGSLGALGKPCRRGRLRALKFEARSSFYFFRTCLSWPLYPMAPMYRSHRTTRTTRITYAPRTARCRVYTVGYTVQYAAGRLHRADSTVQYAAELCPQPRGSSPHARREEVPRLRPSGLLDWLGRRGARSPRHGGRRAPRALRGRGQERGPPQQLSPSPRASAGLAARARAFAAVGREAPARLLARLPRATG